MVILNWLRGRPGATRSDPQLPPGHRVYAVGDVHGRADLLRQLLALIAEDAAAAPVAEPRIVFLGDYVDRGLESREVLDLLIRGLPPGLAATHLMGNHEDAMLRFLEAPEEGEAWLEFGGLATLYSYGVRTTDRITASTTPAELAGELAEKLPAVHRDFLAGLALTYALGDFLFVHAGIRPQVPLAAQSRDDLLWIRNEFLTSRADHGCVVVHGHTVCTEPEVRANRIGIDTGAYATGRLTCLVLEGTQHRFLATGTPVHPPAAVGAEGF